ncbi:MULTISPECIES: hypothetical protein [Ensifer]|uniref:hypothetical protein n=1 Tax=Ensifer TaxID=106591 RepID=UPI0007154B81|nr:MULTISPECIES: hypothetical protein [Ensifer]KQX15236.1 hypothetical protein ASD01_32940 [Ensifer sp. Root423]QHG74692.1 hypothetical protein DQW09_33700 [Ensifer adhaerens]SFH45574.1 hypothetical protein SAMN05216459_1352 [Ensifer sp. OV372]
MRVLKTDLRNVTVVVIDLAETAASLEAAFAAAGAAPFVVSDLQSSRRLGPSFLPDVVVMDAGTIADRGGRGSRSGNQGACSRRHYEIVSTSVVRSTVTQPVKGLWPLSPTPIGSAENMDARILKQVHQSRNASRQEIADGLVETIVQIGGEPLTVRRARDELSAVLRKARNGIPQLIGGPKTNEDMAVVISLKDLAELVTAACQGESLGEALDAIGFKPYPGDRIIVGQGRKSELGQLVRGNPARSVRKKGFEP